MSDLDTLAATVREALDNPGQWSRYPNAKTALAALVEHARTLERTARREQETADAYQFDLARAEQRIATLERERNEALAYAEKCVNEEERYEETLREIVNTLGPNHFSGELRGLLVEGNEALRAARAALAGEDA